MGVGHSQAVFFVEVQVDLEQLRVQVLGGIGQALGVDRVVVVRVGHAACQLHVVAVALGVIHQRIGAAIVGTPVHGAAVHLLMVVAAVAVLEHAASVFAVFEQVRGIFGDHAHRTGKAAIAGAYVVGAFFDFEALDQLGLDKNRALHVALKAAFGRTVDGQLHVFGFAQAPDIDGLAARFERAAEVDAGQRGQQARDVIGLVAVDFGLGHGRLADVAGVDLVTAAHHAERAEFEAVAGGGALLFGLHHVGFVHQDQVEIGVFEQSLDGVLRAVVAAQCRGFDVAQQRFVEQ